MLVNVRFKNFRSFYDEADLSMQTASIDEYREINTFYAKEDIFKKNENELLKSAVIFGGNASGKTNVIRVLEYIRSCIFFSAVVHQNIVQKNEYFMLEIGCDELDSIYEVEFVQNEIFYVYGFSTRKGIITREWLKRREERLTKVFERNHNDLEINGLDSKSTRLINVPSSTLFLSIAKSFKLDIMEDIDNVLKWFSNIIIVFENTANSLELYNLENNKYKKQALEILKRADIGIDDFEVIKDKVGDPRNINDVIRLQMQPQIYRGELKQDNEAIYNIDLETHFNVYDKNHNKVTTLNARLFEHYNYNSEGTHRLFGYLGWILGALDEGRVILIDELDSKLHFLVADYILSLFNSIENNPKNAQLIGTAHNTMLMDENLRRDQIYFTAKDAFGKSTLTSLVDYKGVRKEDLFSKKYLAGFYAELPDMSQT